MQATVDTLGIHKINHM